MPPGEYVPIEGDCPFCGVKLKWGDLIRKMKGCKMGDQKKCDDNLSDVDSDIKSDVENGDESFDDKNSDGVSDVDDQKSDGSDDVVCLDTNPCEVAAYPSWFYD